MSEELTLKIPVIGKTYSLYGDDKSSDGFYLRMSSTADEVLSLYDNNSEKLLSLIESVSSSKLKIHRLKKSDPVFSLLIKIITKNFSAYLVNLDKHLKSLSFATKLRDRRLSSSADQYFLFMIEIELTNRIFRKQFSESSRRLAFLPHCLRDFSRECLSASDGTDYLCRGCSKICTVNKLSKFLKGNNVTPYIWMDADLKKIFSKSHSDSESLGVLGIACIPELANGMRLCRKYNIPVTGIPLDANRCRRWMGDFYFNTVNFSQLEKVLIG